MADGLNYNWHWGWVHNVDISALKPGASTITVTIKRNGVVLYTKEIGINMSSGVLKLADHEGKDENGWWNHKNALMSNIYPTIYKTMKTVPDQIIWDGIHGCYQMFKDCEALESIDMSALDVSSTFFSDDELTSFFEMFMNCKSLRTIDLSHINAANGGLSGLPLYSTRMFSGCSSLTSVNLTGMMINDGYYSSFQNRQEMFKDCINLEIITGVIDMTNLSSPCYLYSSGEEFTTGYDNMFKNCPKLRNVQIKNPPADFEAVSGLSSSQYVVVS